MTDLISKSALVDALTEQANNATKIAVDAKGRAIDYHSGKARGLVNAAIVANSAPTIDALPVVRCRECWKATFYHGIYGCEVGLHEAEWYCADGERGEDDNRV